MQKLHEELVALLKRDGFVTARDADRMARWDHFDQNRHADFFDVEWMFGLPRAPDNSEAVFDIVIGNPPYVRQEEIKELKPLLKDAYHYECYTGTADLFVYFYERSVKLLKPQGVLSFITSNKWYRAKYGEALRLFMATQTHLNSIIDFGDAAVFTAIAYPTIVIATRREKPLNPPPASDTVQALNWSQEAPVDSFPAVFGAQSFSIPQAELKRSGWQLEPPVKRQLLARVVGTGVPLRKYVGSRVSRGITTGLNEAFVITSEIRSRLIAEDPKSAEIIKPFLRGRDVKRWRVEPQDLWLIFTRRPFNLANYPAIQKHLTQFRNQLEPKPERWNDKKDGAWPGRKTGSYQWYEIQDNIAYWQEFEQPKIVSTKVSTEPTFSQDSDSHYLGNTAYFIPISEGDLFLLALLNSTVSTYYARERFVGKQNGYYEVQPEVLEAFPVPPATSQQKAVLNIVVNCVLTTGDARFEQLINGLVFELFFPDDLHRANIHLFDACEKAGVGQLATLKGKALATAAHELAERIFANDHPIYTLLFDLQGLDVVRIVEGRS